MRKKKKKYEKENSEPWGCNSEDYRTCCWVGIADTGGKENPPTTAICFWNAANSLQQLWSKMATWVFAVSQWELSKQVRTRTAFREISYQAAQELMVQLIGYLVKCFLSFGLQQALFGPQKRVKRGVKLQSINWLLSSFHKNLVGIWNYRDIWIIYNFSFLSSFFTTF